MKRIGLLMMLILSLVSCKKPSDRACWKGSGPAQTLQVAFDDFQYLHVHANMEVTLIQDSLNFIEWEANENLMKFLKAEKDLDTLVLRNTNRCHFLRYGKEKVSAKVHFTELKQLLFENSELVKTNGIWQQNAFEFILKEGAGPIDVELSGTRAFVRNLYGWQAMKLSGHLSWVFADLDGSATLDATNLSITDSLLFTAASPKSSYFQTSGLLVKAQLHSIGNLYLKGLPSLLLKNEYSAGRVVVQ
ncbi:MAG: hypothetical protein RLZZ357_1983 [Bacteroidota bacterium]|jgi:hypothetical protein